MHKLIISFLFSLFLIPVSAQEYEIKSFDITPEDLSAVRNPQIDLNGRQCAILKVYADDKIVEVEGEFIGDIISKGMEQWIYVPHDSRRIKLYFDNHFPVSVVFKDFNYPSLTGGMTYLLKLKSDIQTANNTQPTSSPQQPTTPANTAQPSVVHQPAPADNKDEEIIRKMNAAFAKADFKKAIDIAKKSKNPKAQFILGSRYAYGHGIKQDYNEAYNWWLLSANQNNPEAMAKLGWLYSNGFGVSKDYDQAMKWFQKAAELGNTSAMCSIGHLYKYANGVSQDYAETMKWFRKAALLGDSDAMTYIGHLYKNAQGVNKDYSAAYDWYKKAADLGNGEAMAFIGVLYENGEGVPKDYDKAIEWYQKGIDAGNTYAEFKLDSLKTFLERNSNNEEIPSLNDDDFSDISIYTY